MKKRTIVISGILLAIGLLIGVVVYAQSMIKEVSHQGFHYTIWGERVTIKAYDGEEEVLEIPQRVRVDDEEMVITHIGKSAFAGNEVLRRVIIEANIIEIGDGAFANCANLERVEFLGDAPKMGARVFDGTPEGLVLLYPMGSSGYEDAVFSYSAQPFFLVQYLDTASDGGQVPKDDGRYKEGDEVVAQGNIGNLTKEGHTFIGWKDEEGNVYQEGDAIPVGTNHVQLVPHWEINRYQVVFHSNGGGDLEDMEVEWNSTIPEPKKLERKDHIFVNWFKDKDFKEVWNFQGQRVTEDVDLYAKWVAIPSVPSGFSAKTGGYDQIQLTWNGVKGATGYEIHRSTSKDGDFKKIAETSSTSYMDKGLVSERTYYYRVKAYTIDGEVEAFGDLSGIASAKGKLLTPNSITVKRGDSNSMELSWSTSVGATGYEIYKASSSSGKFEYLGSTKSTSYRDSKGTWNRGNYYKVRAYRKVGDGKVYSDYTSTKGYARVGDAVHSILSSASNRNSIHQQVIRLHGSTSNACVVFVSESLRRAGVNVPTTMRTIDYLVPYLSNNGWVKSRDYKNIRKGDVVFTTDAKLDPNGRPTHTYIFMGWVEPGNYDYAWIVDNQARYYNNQVLHKRNFIIVDAVDGDQREPFSFYMTNR